MSARKLIVRINEGRQTDKESVEEAIQCNLDGLYRFALRLTRDADEARDITQDAALKAWEQRASIVRSPRAWLFQTVYHNFISRQRHKNRWKETDGEESWDSETLESYKNSLPEVIVREDVRRAIEALPEELRAVVWLSDAEEFLLREIAQILEWPLGTVASRLWRARNSLRELLAEYRAPGEKRL
ncbi:MAG: RNA polymerase sigma factor [Candidatus Micrarchaeaceae archaeon]